MDKETKQECDEFVEDMILKENFKIEEEKEQLIIELKEYLEGFISKYKNHTSLHLIDISGLLRTIREYDKQMNKFKPKSNKWKGLRNTII